jgi:hypothetical protein
MFLVEDRRPEATYLVFTFEDPRQDGYSGEVDEDVALDYDMLTVHCWRDGERSPDACLGRSLQDRKQYQVFKYADELLAAGFEPVPGTFICLNSWSAYLKLRLEPPDPEQTPDERWYDYLDKLDINTRRWRQRGAPLVTPASGNRDDVAAWLARRHFIADSGIREVWYLPEGAPPNEIRLLEINDRFAGNEAEVEPVDFGLDIEGAPLRLFVADITSDQLDRIQKEPTRLPHGWSLAGVKKWRRGA